MPELQNTWAKADETERKKGKESATLQKCAKRSPVRLSRELAVLWGVKAPPWCCVSGSARVQL